MSLLLSLLALSSADPPPERPAAELRQLWVDWRTVTREAAESERRADRPPAEPQRAEALGARVGELVAVGDCEGGERLARDAGDFALVEAVRRHCRTGPAR